MGIVLGWIVAAAAWAAMLYTLRLDRQGKVRLAGAANIAIFLSLLIPGLAGNNAAAAAVVASQLVFWTVSVWRVRAAPPEGERRRR